MLGGFKWITSEMTTNSLIIFVTPTIIKPDGTRFYNPGEKDGATNTIATAPK